MHAHDKKAVATLREADPTLSRQAARKAVRLSLKRDMVRDGWRRGPNPTIGIRSVLGPDGQMQQRSFHLGHFHAAQPVVPRCAYQRKLLAR